MSTTSTTTASTTAARVAAAVFNAPRVDVQPLSALGGAGVVACSTWGSLYSDYQDVQVWAYSPDRGFVALPTDVWQGYGRNANGTPAPGYAVTADLLRAHPDATHLLVRFTRVYTDNQNRCSDFDQDDYTLYVV